ncbi:MAG: alpha/beta fold hydrolase [Bacteroidota bacterium]
MKRIPLLLTLVLSFQLVLGQNTTKKELAPELLFKKSKQSQFSISPDGKLFMELVKGNNSYDIVIVDIDNYKVLHQIPMGSRSIQKLVWLNDRRIAYSSQGLIEAMDIDGENEMTLVDYKFDNKNYRNYYNLKKMIRINSLYDDARLDRKHVLFQSTNYKFYSVIKKVNVFTGQEFTIMDGTRHKINRWLVDKKGKPVAGLRIEDDTFRYFVENPSSRDWIPLKVKFGEHYHPVAFSGKTFLNQPITYEGAGFEKDIIYITSNVQSDKRKLFSYNYRTHQIIDTLASDKNCDIGDPDGEDLALIFDFKNEKLGGVVYQGIRPQFIPFSEDFKRISDTLRTKYKNYFSQIIDVDKNNNRVVVRQWSDTYAGNIGVHDMETGDYSVMVDFNPELEEYKLSKTKIVGLKNREGKRLPSYLNLPDNYTNEEGGKPVPLVVIPHGGPFARDYWDLDAYAQYFSYKGYAVLRPNFQGSVGFGKSHVMAGIRGINTVMIDDIADATQHIMDNFNVDKEKTYVFGHSYGGYATYMSLVRYPELFKAGVAIGAPSDIKLLMKSFKKDGSDFAYEFWKSVLGGRDSDYLKEISPISYVKDIKKPILVFHGRNDGIVPIEQTEVMQEAFRKKGKTDTFTIIESQGHSIENSNSIGYVLEESELFFKRQR